jgi:hypothetical protein
MSLEGLKARLETVCGTPDVSERLMAMAEEAEGKMLERTEKVREMLLGKMLPERKVPLQQMP